MKGYMKYIILIPLYVYKYAISPFLQSTFGHGCRFSPTCSEYAIEAVQKCGILKGIKMAFVRLGKCHPWSNTMFDPIP